MYSTCVVIDIESGEILDRDRIPYDGPLELCDKKEKAAANRARTTAEGTAGGYGSVATGIGSTLVPEYTREATHPTGYNPNDINATLVAGEQGAGGATGSIAGEAGLRAARSRNTGALSGILDEAARTKTRQLSQNALGVQTANMQEKARQRSEGLKGLEGLYGTDVGAQLKAEGLVPEDINAALNANKTGWGKDLMDWMQTLEGGAIAGKQIHG
jgi:hypothetical protein